MRVGSVCFLLLASLTLVAGQRKRPVRIHLNQNPDDKDLAVVEQNDTNLSFSLSVRRRPQSGKRRKSPPSDKTSRPAGAQAKPVAPVAEKPVSSSSSSRTQADQSRGGSSSPSVQKQREGIGFIRKQGQRPGGPRQSLAVQGELFAERSRPVTGGGRRTGAQSAPELSAGTTTSSSNEPKRKKAVKKKKKKAPRPVARPAARPATQTATRPVSRTQSRPASRPASRPPSRPAPRPASRPASRPAARPTSRPAQRPAAKPVPEPVQPTSGSEGPQIYELDDVEIDQILQDARQFGRSQRLISSTPVKGRAGVRRRKSKRPRLSFRERSRSSGLTENNAVTPVIASDGFESVGSLSRKIKPRPGALLASRRPQERNPSIAEDPLKKEEVIRIKERVGLPRRAEVKIVDPEDDVEEASKAKMSSLEKAKTTARLRFRNQLPRRDQSRGEGARESTTPRSSVRPNISRLRPYSPRILAKIDPRTKASVPAASPTVSVSVSHSVSESTANPERSSKEKMTSKDMAMEAEKVQASKEQSSPGEIPQKQGKVDLLGATEQKIQKAQSTFRIRAQTPTRKQEAREESVKHSTDRKPFNQARIRGGVLPKVDQEKKRPIQSTSRKSFGFDPSRLRSRLVPKIDPRSKQTKDSKSPDVSVSVSHSVSVAVPKLKLAENTSTATVRNIPHLTTTAHPTFNLVEPVRVVASTESYLGEVAPVTQQNPATPTVGKVSTISRAGLHEDEEAEKAPPVPAGDGILLRQKKRRRGPARPGAIKSTGEGDKAAKIKIKKKVMSNDTRRTSVPRLRLKSSRPKEVAELKTSSEKHSRNRAVNPYQRSRQRGGGGGGRKQNEDLPEPYESKVYGLPQNPTATDGLEDAASSGPASYIDTAINHAEVTWSQDPFRRDSFQSEAAEPTFDIDFSKDPSNKGISQPKTVDVGVVNLFATKDDATNAIDNFYKGSFVFDTPVGRSEVANGARRKVVVGRPVNTEVIPQVTPRISAIKTVPRIQQTQVVPEFLKGELVPQITTAEEPPAIPIKLFDPFTFYRNL